MTLQPRFQAIPHDASTLIIEMFIDGPGAQPVLNDESWGIDNLRGILLP